MFDYKDKYCRGCRKSHPIGNFSPRRDDPKRFYDYCDEARKGIYVRRRNKQSYQQEIAELRAKAKSLRKLDYSQALEIKKRRGAGESITSLASEYNVGKSTISKATSRPESYK